ncbi:ATP-binding protein [uncultured Herbaspirillum sp.]|uniref:sensor histidine kinase n=1 Tax=uncultured Herbaspirillum sp. TaxID=160236 RepID=UPI00261D6BFA|nr:ATP-binding protein [uncultured Herbaspirillum sp.]
MSTLGRPALSLRLRLMAIIGLSLLLLWSAVSLWMLLDVRQHLREALDDRLASSARMVAGLMATMPRNLPSQGRTMPLDVIGRDGLACEVSLMRGEVAERTLARTAGSPRLNQLPLGYGVSTFGGKLWRTYVLEDNGMRIATADRIDSREGLLREIALAAALPFAIAFVGMLLAVWFGVNWGLAPLERLRKRLERRNPEDVSALPQEQCPTELLPFASTVDRLVVQIGQALMLERRFTDGAAHELRTPLTAIKLHLQIAQMTRQQPDQPDKLDEALDMAHQGVERMQHLIEQLLALARIDGDTHPHAISDLSLVLQSVARSLPAMKSDRLTARIEALDAGRESVRIAMPEVLLGTVLRNVIDNALAYSPSHCRVELECDLRDDEVELRVLDRGCGFSDDDRLQVGRRFWRGPQSAKVQGSGLGLAIVNGILQRYQGSLALFPRAGGGTVAAVVFKRYYPASPHRD